MGILINLNVNYGLKFIDLIDYTNSDYTYSDVVKKINDYLTLNCKNEYFINNDDLWNDFITRFVRRFLYRTISFDTYFQFCIKLNDVFSKNKVKLNNMYNAKLIEFNPLYTTNLKTTNKNDNVSESNGDKTIKDNGWSTSEDDGYNNRTDDLTRTDNLKNINKSDNTSNDYNLHSDAPRSSVDLDNMFKTDNNYITDATNSKNHNEANTTTSQTGTVSNSGTSKNKIYNKNTNHISNHSNEISVDKIKNSQTGENLTQGYTGNPTELLEKYVNFVIDMNEFLLEEIENNNLFMSIVL